MKKPILALMIVILAILACKKAEPCDLDPSACVTTATASVTATPTASPAPSLATLFPTWTPAATVTVTPPAAVGDGRAP